MDTVGLGWPHCRQASPMKIFKMKTVKKVTETYSNIDSNSLLLGSDGRPAVISITKVP